MTVKILVGDCREVLKTLPDCSIQCCVTSPPYYALRNYDADDQIGLEETPEAFVEQIVLVFREVRRVLRDDGTLWLNLGDSYASRPNGSIGKESTLERQFTSHDEYRRAHAKRKGGVPAGMKHKDLMGIPWAVAFALRADGWWLRQEIIWSKPNVMPESVFDRCTKAHEHLFLLTKSGRYFYDAEAIMEPSSPETHARTARGRSKSHKYADGGPDNQTIAKVSPSAGRLRRAAEGRDRPGVSPKSTLDVRHGRVKNNADFTGAISGEVLPMRNKRSVWEIRTAKYSGQHYATFPPALVEPCILAGSRPRDTVLDPFGGAGTTGMVAERLGRESILIELNPGYAEDGANRIRADNLGRGVEGAPKRAPGAGLPLFGDG